MASACTRTLRRAALLALVLALLGAGTVSTASAGTSSVLMAIGAGLKGRAGLSATVAAEGLTHVSALAFDDDGRLWALTAGYEDDGTDALYVIPEAGSGVVLTQTPTPTLVLTTCNPRYSSRERLIVTADRV